MLILPPEIAAQLNRLAEALTGELLAVEEELKTRRGRRLLSVSNAVPGLQVGVRPPRKK